MSAHRTCSRICRLVLDLLLALFALGLLSEAASPKGCEDESPARVPDCWADALNNSDLAAIDEMLTADFVAVLHRDGAVDQTRSRADFLASLGPLFDPKQTAKLEARFSDSLVVTERSLTKWKLDGLLLLAVTPRSSDGGTGKTSRRRIPVTLFLQRTIEPFPHYELSRWEEFGKEAAGLPL
jgi:hypothetical protein